MNTRDLSELKAHAAIDLLDCSVSSQQWFGLVALFELGHLPDDSKKSNELYAAPPERYENLPCDDCKHRWMIHHYTWCYMFRECPQMLWGICMQRKTVRD